MVGQRLRRDLRFWNICDGEERVRAAVVLLHTLSTESPLAVVADVAQPELRVGEATAAVAKASLLESVSGVRFGHAR